MLVYVFCFRCYFIVISVVCRFVANGVQHIHLFIAKYGKDIYNDRTHTKTYTAIYIITKPHIHVVHIYNHSSTLRSRAPTFTHISHHLFVYFSFDFC